MARFAAGCLCSIAGMSAFAQVAAPPQGPTAGGRAATPPQGRGRGGPPVVSPEIGADGRVTFRLLAPQATSVSVGGDINGGLVPDPNAATGSPAVTMTKGENGVWAGTTARAVKAGAWR